MNLQNVVNTVINQNNTVLIMNKKEKCMDNNRLPIGTAQITRFVRELGGITDAQINLLLGENKVHKDYYVRSLNRLHIVEEQPGVYTLKKNKERNQFLYTKDMQLCAWVLLCNEGISFEPGCEDYYRGEHPTQLFFQKEDIVYNLVYIDLNRKGTIQLLQQKYYARMNTLDDDGSFRYVFVIDDERTLEMLKSMQIVVPNVIAHVKFTGNEIPVIDYYE